MKIKFNKYERVAGIFVLGALIGSVVVTATMAIKKGWFSSKIEYQTVFKSAEGLHEGTEVQVSGLRAGSVQEVHLVKADEIIVKFYVFEKFQKLIREDSFVQVVRPFIIGEKVIDVAAGNEETKMLQRGETIPSKAAFDVMDLVSGRKLGPFLANLEGLLKNMSSLAEAFGNEERAESFVKMFDKLEPMIANVNEMAIGFTDVAGSLNRKKRLEKMLPNIVALLQEMNKMIPVLQKEVPDVYQHVPQLISNLNELTTEFKKLTPAITAVAPDMPNVGIRMVELLNEAVITMKAMQKSFFMRGNVEEVLAEEAKNKRTPANAEK